jgi:CHASE2 domain-containing sensor protein
MHKLTRSPAAIAVLISGVVGLGLVGLKSAGALEGLELAAYDWCVRLLQFEAKRDERVVLIPITERDIQELDT